MFWLRSWENILCFAYRRKSLLIRGYQCGTQFGSHEWKVDPIWFTSIFKKTSTQINLIFGRKVVWICRNLMQLSDSKSVHPNTGKRKSKNTMGNDCPTHDVSGPSSKETVSHVKPAWFLCSWQASEHQFSWPLALMLSLIHRLASKLLYSIPLWSVVVNNKYVIT